MATGSFIAFSSARCRRWTRMTFAWIRSTLLMAMPYVSAWTTAWTKLQGK